MNTLDEISDALKEYLVYVDATNRKNCEVIDKMNEERLTDFNIARIIPNLIVPNIIVADLRGFYAFLLKKAAKK